MIMIHLKTRINANILFYEVLYRQIIFGKLGMKTTELHNLYKVLNFPKRYFNTVDYSKETNHRVIMNNAYTKKHSMLHILCFMLNIILLK